jgi:hypothetical protein
MGPYAGADYNLDSKVDSNTCIKYIGQSYAIVSFIPQTLWDFRFGLWDITGF